MDLLGRGVAQAALESNAVLIDEGTREGVSAIVGQGVADRGGKSKLIGVLPQGKPAGAEPSADELDPNHTHFIRDEQEKDVSPDDQRLANLLAQKRARWQLGRLDELLIE